MPLPALDVMGPCCRTFMPIAGGVCQAQMMLPLLVQAVLRSLASSSHRPNDGNLSASQRCCKLPPGIEGAECSLQGCGIGR